MPGLRMSIVVCATSFMLGLLFTDWIADSLTLWRSPDAQTDASLWTAAAYYSILSRMHPLLAYIYAAVTACGGLTILWSLRDGRAGNLMFDGGSIFLYGTTVYMYLHSVLPNFLTNFAALPLPSVPAALSSAPPPALPLFPPELRQPTLELASSHLVCSVMLTGVLFLQACRWWAEQDDDVDESLLADGDGDKGAERKARKHTRRKSKAKAAAEAKKAL